LGKNNTRFIKAQPSIESGVENSSKLLQAGKLKKLKEKCNNTAIELNCT
jgi:hypothetical protein